MDGVGQKDDNVCRSPPGCGGKAGSSLIGGGEGGGVPTRESGL